MAELSMATKAKIRNWTKARLVSFRVDTTVLTEMEKIQANRINQEIRQLLEDWDISTEVLGFKVKPYQCSVCGRKSTGKYEDEDGMLYCLKHYKKFVLNNIEEP
jgi:hypothetical protein